MAWFADKLIAASGGDYTTLAAFENAYDGEDISSTDGVRARVKGETGDTSTIYFAGWLAGQSASCKIVITAETGYGLQDRVNWKGADGSGDDARINKPLLFNETSNALFADMYNIEFMATLGFTNAGAESVFRCWNCLLRDGTSHGLYTSSGTMTIYLANLLIRD